MERSLGFIRVHADNWNFTCDGEVFIPFGTNYFDPHTGWAPKLWKMFDEHKVRAHYQMMADIGVNVARVFLTSASFQPKADTISEEGLHKLDTMIDIAKESNIRLILTGPDHWEGVPDYLKPDKYAGEQALSALECFWHEVASRYKDEATIFAWDLLNEPEVPWKSDVLQKKWRLWLRDKYGDSEKLSEAWKNSAPLETIESASIPEDHIDLGNQKLYDYQLFRESIAYEWTKRQVDAIRSVDPNHLVTIGLIQWSFPLLRAPWGDRPNQPGRYAAFNPVKLSPLLDFISIHFYPILGDPGEPEAFVRNTQYLQAVVNFCYVGKPVVLEEFGWHGGGEFDGKFRTEQYQSDWNTHVVRSTMDLVSGWLVWAFSDTPESTDLTKYGGLYNAEGHLKEWGKSFSSLSSELASLKKLVRSERFKDVTLDEMSVLTGDVRQIYQDYLVRSGIVNE